MLATDALFANLYDIKIVRPFPLDVVPGMKTGLVELWQAFSASTFLVIKASLQQFMALLFSQISKTVFAVG